MALTKYKRAKYERALEFAKSNACAKVFALWSRKYEITIETQMNTRIAVLHHDSRAKTDVLTRWYTAFNLKLQDEINQVTDKSLIF